MMGLLLTVDRSCSSALIGCQARINASTDDVGEPAPTLSGKYPSTPTKSSAEYQVLYGFLTACPELIAAVSRPLYT